MSDPHIKWFKHGTSWNVKFTGFRSNEKCHKNITIFEHEDDRKEAIRVAVGEIAKYGYTDITIDHIVKVG